MADGDLNGRPGSDLIGRPQPDPIGCLHSDPFPRITTKTRKLATLRALSRLFAVREVDARIDRIELARLVPQLMMEVANEDTSTSQAGAEVSGRVACRWPNSEWRCRQ